MTPRAILQLVAFLAAALACFFIALAAVGMAGMAGPQAAPWHGATFAALLFLVTFLFSRAGGESMRANGFDSSSRRWRDLAAGFLAGALALAAVSLIVGSFAEAGWRTNGSFALTRILAGLGSVLALFLAEEFLFRGYAFTRLARTLGSTAALVFSAAAFGFYHVAGSEFSGAGLAYAFTLPALGGLVFGYALIRSGGLALPIGLHWGGNWVQSAVFGLGQVQDGTGALWVKALSPEERALLASPDLTLWLPYLAALVAMAAFVRAMPAGRPNAFAD